MAKSKFFRAFVAGNTISDGRVITPEMIDEIVATFNAETYSPRINIEHIAGYSPEPPFNGYGDVIAVKAQDDEITIDGKAETRRALYVQVEGNKQLVKLAADDQKPFPSVEITGSYAGTGKVGLVGLAFTDNPASIATQKVKFSSTTPGSMFAFGTESVALEFDAAPADSTSIADAIAGGFAKVAAMFSKEPEKPKQQEPAKPANDNFDVGAFTTAIGQEMGKQLADALKPTNDAFAALKTEVDGLKAKLEKTPDTSFNRPPATGGGASILTDC